MSDPRLEMRRALEAQAIKLAHVRGSSRAEAARSIARSVAVNLADSRGTSDEIYWREMSAIADELAR